MAKPPGGSVEQPVVNCRNAFLSSDDIPHKTLTKRRKPGLEERQEESVYKKKQWLKQRRMPSLHTLNCAKIKP